MSDFPALLLTVAAVIPWWPLLGAVLGIGVGGWVWLAFVAPSMKKIEEGDHQ